MGYPQLDGLQWKIPLKMDDLGVPLFQETSNYRKPQRCGLSFKPMFVMSDRGHTRNLRQNVYLPVRGVSSGVINAGGWKKGL